MSFYDVSARFERHIDRDRCSRIISSAMKPAQKTNPKFILLPNLSISLLLTWWNHLVEFMNQWDSRYCHLLIWRKYRDLNYSKWGRKCRRTTKNVACLQTPPSPFWGEGASLHRLQKTLAEKKALEYNRIPKYHRDFRDYVLRYPNVERNNLIPTT